METDASNDKANTKPIRMFRHVEDVVLLAAGNILVVMEMPLRDEAEGFGMLDAAVSNLKGVKSIMTFPLRPFRGQFNMDLSAKVQKLVERLKPVPPGIDRDFDAYASDLRAWRKVASVLFDVATNALKS